MWYNRIGMLMCTAAADGEASVDSLLVYLDNNRRFDEGSLVCLGFPQCDWMQLISAGLISRELD